MSRVCNIFINETQCSPCFRRALLSYMCFPDVHFYIGRRGTRSADTTSATTRQAHVSMKRMGRATAVRTAPTVPLPMDHMTCAALFMISGTQWVAL